MKTLSRDLIIDETIEGEIFLKFFWLFEITCNPLSAKIFYYSLEDRVLHKEAWVAKLLTHLSIQVHKKVKFSWRDNSSLAVKGLNIFKYYFENLFYFENLLPVVLVGV